MVQWLALAVFLVSGLKTALAAGDLLQGSHVGCVAGRLQNLTYSVKLAVSSDSIVELDSLTALEKLFCDNDGSQLKIMFHDEIHSTALWAKIKLGNVFLTGGVKHGCPMAANVTSSGFLMRRVVSAQLAGQYVITRTSLAQYDEIYEDADIKYNSAKSPACEAELKEKEKDKHICFGVNVEQNAQCAGALAPIPIYSNQFVTLTCDDCYAGFAADAFFDVKIKGFALQKLAGGLKGAAIHAGVDLDLQAQASWSVGLDKVLLQAGGQQNPVLAFKVGPVPFVLWFEAVLEMTGDVSLMANAEAKAGGRFNYTLGDSYVSWDPENRWQHTHLTPTLDIEPTVASATASFQGTANFALTPRVEMHANQLFTYQLKLQPQLDLQVQGDSTSQKICESVKYDIALTSMSELQLNIDWAHIHEDRMWGPKTIWQKNGNISQTCVPVKAEEEPQLVV